ncbi:hypothetical protein GUITHDRAFT_111790 [Guillardia theta CCMP2712]|uniref:F-box/LRR-repeat protein 15-like leucin rich repeat domain-containing protein n=2 Tax=Guillardia theta TaxID=55529 RepID=L1J119_GUITC|nr:hypothetical protein GUITHDRAFT_111790 [Guillardia theta CCMP2712]EKX42228.1 hypothetical protein GUITHDRAFT_111790 [Guillardia theta CCMP2712]|eukprot:XP_005829208.1 hypothetical protein GUITHDRAFT_111790 [Guillardia theta CCMP2712]
MESLTGEQKALLLNEVSRISSGELLNANKDLASFLASGASDIDLSGCSLLRPEVCKDMFTSVGSMQLISMNISDCHPYMSGLMLSEVWDHVPRLEKLEFRATSLLLNFNRAIKDLAVKCERITHIDLSLSVNLSDDAVSTLLASCRELRVLKVANCPRITDDAFRVQPISSSLAELEMWGNRAITDVALQRIGCNEDIRLRRLLLTGTSTTSRGLQSLNLDEVRTLELGECELFVEDIRFILLSARNLERLDLSWCDNVEDEMLGRIAGHAQCLTHLDMRKCSEITDVSMEQLCSTRSQLVHLGLARCDSLGDSSVRSICNHCKTLQSLDLSWLNEVTAAGIEEVVCKLSCLTSLKLEGCKPLCDSHLEMASRNLKVLREFHMGWCNSPTDDMIDELVTKLPSVIVWDYYGREHVGDLAKKRTKP